MARFCGTVGFTLNWVHTTEVLPTTVLATGHGIANTAGRVGGLCVPPPAVLSRLRPANTSPLHPSFVPFYIQNVAVPLYVGVSALVLLIFVSTYAISFLKETKGRNLKTTMDERSTGSISTDGGGMVGVRVDKVGPVASDLSDDFGEEGGGYREMGDRS